MTQIFEGIFWASWHQEAHASFFKRKENWKMLLAAHQESLVFLDHFTIIWALPTQTAALKILGNQIQGKPGFFPLNIGWFMRKIWICKLTPPFPLQKKFCLRHSRRYSTIFTWAEVVGFWFRVSCKPQLFCMIWRQLP